MLISQIKMVRGMGHSVIAFYAADSGVEEALFLVRQTSISLPYHGVLRTIQLDEGNVTTYRIRIERGLTGNCNKNYYCIRSEGDFRGIKRAIEVGN